MLTRQAEPHPLRCPREESNLQLRRSRWEFVDGMRTSSSKPISTRVDPVGVRPRAPFYLGRLTSRRPGERRTAGELRFGSVTGVANTTRLST
jgi:hypothetical protein